MPMIDIQHISKWYGDFQVLTDCTTSIEKGDVVVVCGPSGSGKSTLIKTVNALEPFQQGDIIVDGVSLKDPKTDLAKFRSRVGMVFQHFELFPHMTVLENLTIAQVKVLKRSVAEAREKGLKYLERVGLLAHKDKFKDNSLVVSSNVLQLLAVYLWTQSVCCLMNLLRHSTLKW